MSLGLNESLRVHWYTTGLLSVWLMCDSKFSVYPSFKIVNLFSLITHTVYIFWLRLRRSVYSLINYKQMAYPYQAAPLGVVWSGNTWFAGRHRGEMSLFCSCMCLHLYTECNLWFMIWSDQLRILLKISIFSNTNKVYFIRDLVTWISFSMI